MICGSALRYPRFGNLETTFGGWFAIRDWETLISTKSGASGISVGFPVEYFKTISSFRTESSNAGHVRKAHLSCVLLDNLCCTIFFEFLLSI